MKLKEKKGARADSRDFEVSARNIALRLSQWGLNSRWPACDCRWPKVEFQHPSQMATGLGSRGCPASPEATDFRSSGDVSNESEK